MPFELHPSFPGPVHGGDRISSHRDRRCSHGHGQSTAHDIGHHEAWAVIRELVCVQASPLMGFGARNRARDLRRDPSGGQGSQRAAGPAPDRGHPVRLVRRIGCRHVHRHPCPRPAPAHPLNPCIWAPGFGLARREVYFADEVYFAEHVTPKEKVRAVLRRKS
jgi:hypothetical protein